MLKLTSDYGTIYNNQKSNLFNAFGKLKEAIEKTVPTFDEFITEYGLIFDCVNEYFFNNEYYSFEGLYYAYADFYKIKP